MKITYVPTHVVINLFTAQMPEGTSYVVHVPEWASSIAVDEDGKIHAFEDRAVDLLQNQSEWDTLRGGEEVADLEFEVENCQGLSFDLNEFDSDTRCGGIFEIRNGV